MPKRIKKLHQYFVPSPEWKMSNNLRNYLDSFPKKADWSVKARKVFESDSDFLRSFLELEKGMRENSDFWKTRFQTCEQLRSLLTSPESFYVVRFKYFSNPNAFSHGGVSALDVLWNYDDIPLIQSALDEKYPFKFATEICRRGLSISGGRVETYYLFGNQLWTLTREDEAANDEELRLLFLEAIDKDRSKIERLRRKFSGAAGASTESRREAIPENVRIFVWRRDEGKCVRCGSNERLEFDHIIPFIKGGSNTERNIQLLCEVCNRAKSANI